MKYRVEELAARARVSVDTVRFYQARDLLDPPERDGRIGWYDDAHLERLTRIRELKDKGFSLNSIRLFLRGELDEVDRALVEEIAAAPASEAGGLVTRTELAERLGVPASLLEAIEREGLLVPRAGDGEPRYSRDDEEALAAGLEILQAGLPLGELLALARQHDEAARAVAERAVDAFAEFVTGPIRAAAPDDARAAQDVVAAFRRMLPAVSQLVSHHFRSVLLAAARERLGVEADAVDDDALRPR